MNNKAIAALLLLILTACSSTTNNAKTSSLCPPKACNVIAEEVAWPVQKNTEGLDAKAGPWTFTLPPNPTKITTLQTVPVSVFQYSKASIAFEYVDKVALADYIEVDLEKSHYKVIDHPRIAYSTTLNHAEPATRIDKIVWRWIFATKRLDLQYGGPAYVAHKNDLTVYYTGETSPSWDAHAIVTSTLFPDRYLKVQLQGFNQDDLKEIIASIK